MSQALARAIEIVGGQTQLARLLGVKQANVWHWLNRADHVPAEFALAIERATGGQVARHELRPDLYPEGAAKEDAAIPEEDLWRAQVYSLLARCLVRQPDTALLTALGQLKGNDTVLGQAFAALAAASADTSLERALDEYDRLFIGLPRGELVPYASYYRTGFLYERPLAKLRADMKRIGFAAADGVYEPEDHIGALCEMMGLMIAGDGAEHPAAALNAQERFFRQHLAPWAERFFADLEKAEGAKLYKPVGSIGRLFIGIETQAFALAA